MEKYLKYLMLLFVAALSVSFTACGDDDDEPEKNEGTDISMAGELNTVTVEKYEDFTDFCLVDVGCRVYHYSLQSAISYIGVRGGKIVYAGDFQNLSKVTTVPLAYSNYSDHEMYYRNGCYVIKSDTGKYIRLKVISSTQTSETYQF